MIVLLGPLGQLGRDLKPRLSGEVISLSRAEVDLSDFAAVRAKLTEIRPRMIVNCAAYNFVDKAESEPDAAFAVNSWVVRNLAQISRDLDSILVQFSTDYVFGLDSTRQEPWNESDAPGPVSVYGLSKLTGEYLVRTICPKHFVIRTCGLYGVWGTGGKGGNFVETMLRVAGQGKPLKVVNDQFCTPSFTSDVADATVQLLKTSSFGLYHLTNSGSCTWFEFAREIFRQSGLNPSLAPIPSSEYPLPARRPGYSILSLSKLQSLGISSPRPWSDALAQYLTDRKVRGS